GQGRGAFTETAPAADTQDAVDDQVRVGESVGCLLADVRASPADSVQRVPAAFVQLWTGLDDCRPRPALGQPGGGIERVAAVVAGPGQYHDPGAVDPAEKLGTDRSEPGGGPLHQRALRDGLHQGVLGCPDIADRVRLSHRDYS